MNSQSVAEHTTYDGMGRLKTHSDFKGQITAYFYDNDTTLGLPSTS